MNIDRLKETFFKLLSIDSPYKKERKTLEYIKGFLNNIGVDYYEDESGKETGCDCGNLIVGGDGYARVTFISHMDTIKIYEDKQIIIDNQGVIKGENGGVIGIDDKSGIAIMLEMISILTEQGGIPEGVHFVFLTNEELDFSGAKFLAERHFINAFNFVLDSGKRPVGLVVIKGADHYCFNAKITGIMSHVGNMANVHSLQTGAKIIEALNIGRRTEHSVLNISNVICESNPSTVPKTVVLEGQLLSFKKEEAKELLTEIRNTIESISNKNGCTAEFCYECKAPGFDTEENSDIVLMAKKAAERENLVFCAAKTGAGSDAHVISYRGGKVIKISTGMMNVHTDDEWISIYDMIKCVRYCLAIIIEIKGHTDFS